MIENEIKTVSDLFHKHRPNDNVNLHQPIWHYTSIEGLMGITHQGKRTLDFWFTRSDCLNDTSEGIHIIEMFREICRELYEQNSISESFWEVTKAINIPTHHIISYPLPRSEDYEAFGMVDAAPCEAYICCFSLKEDSLDMWRYYSKGSGGYSLKFSPLIFEKQEKYRITKYDEKATFYNIDSFCVIYDPDIKKDILRSLVNNAYALYRNHISEQPQEVEKMKITIGSILQSYQFRFKHECFASEQEFRFVNYRPTEKPEHLKNPLPEVQYRNQNGVVVPYINITIEKAHILEVMISPLVENQFCKATTENLLHSRGFTQCNVSKSKLPTRF